MNLAMYQKEIRTRLGDEIGTVYNDAPDKVALLYPSPYHVAMSSLGYQTMYREINRAPGRAADNASADATRTVSGQIGSTCS